MKRLTFTEENFLKTVEGAKWQTRRLHDRPRYQVGDVVSLCEPTQVTHLWEGDIEGYLPSARIVYTWTEAEALLIISPASYLKLINRANWRRPAIARFMLDDFARYWVEITEVREEQLQDISEEDAIAEGIQQIGSRREATNYYREKRVVDAFHTLWDSIHSAQEKRWDANPTVIAYSYKLVQP